MFHGDLQSLEQSVGPPATSTRIRAPISSLARRHSKGPWLNEQWLEVESQNSPIPSPSLCSTCIVFGPAVYGNPHNDKAVESSFAKLEAVPGIYEAHLAKGSLHLAGVASSTPSSSRSMSLEQGNLQHFNTYQG